MSHFAVSAVGRDRPGIVADVSQVIVELGGNIEDCDISILRGQFAAMLIVSGPTELTREELDSRLAPIKEKLGLDAITVGNVAEVHHEDGVKPTHVVRVFGGDRPGIVYAISRRLAQDGVSITNIDAELTEGKEAPVYLIAVEVVIPADVDETALQSSLEEIGDREELEVSLAALVEEEIR